MNSANNQAPTNGIDEVVASVRRKGVRLWSENGQLHYKAHKGALTQADIEKLRALRNQIVAFLEGSTRMERALDPHARSDRAPLTYSQLAHWNLYRLSERSAIRQVASAMRMKGRLDVGVLQESLAEIVRRHDALRTRIIVVDGVPIQEIDKQGDSELRLDDLTSIPEFLVEAEVSRVIDEHILDPIDLAIGPLFGSRLLKIRRDEYVLILAMEHTISDAFSMSLLLRDIFTTYVQILKGSVLSLPSISMQFGEYAVLQSQSQGLWLETHGKYWSESISGYQRLIFPEDRNLKVATPIGVGTIPLRIGREMKAELQEWCRRRSTTLAMSVFAVYVALVLRWCGMSEAVIPFITDGRVSKKIENTIGSFASALYVRVKLFENDTFVDLVKRVMDEYCAAHEHSDASCFTARAFPPEFTKNAAFNWIPCGAATDVLELARQETEIACWPVKFKHPMLRTLEFSRDPVALLQDGHDEISGYVSFGLNRFSYQTMQRFGSNFITLLEGLLTQPGRSVEGISLE